MNLNKLLTLLKKEEHPKLDFKAQLKLKTDGEKKELAKDVIAIANSRGGRGYIIFGIEDKTKNILGINLEDIHEESIQQIINHRCTPPILVEVDVVNYECKDIAVLTIFKSNARPHQMINNGAFYVRRGSTTDVARRDELARMFQENGLVSFENVILKKGSVEDLDKQKIEKIYPYNLLLLENLNIVGESRDRYYPTIGGMLLFGHDPYKYLPHVYIEIIHDNQKEFITGNIISMLDKAEQYISKLCNNPKYPLRGLFDVIANAVIHRDYLDYQRGIIIEIENKNIYVTNPGALLAGNRMFNQQNIHHPRRRNQWLYQQSVVVDTQNRFNRKGLGLKRINEIFKEIGHVQYVNLDTDNLFKVILPSFVVSDMFFI